MFRIERRSQRGAAGEGEARLIGHGAYLGPDYTDDYLHRAALFVKGQYGALGEVDAAQQKTIDDFQANRYDSETNVLALAFSASDGASCRCLEGSFRRGISFGFLGDALLVVFVGSALNPASPDLVLLGVMLAATLLAGLGMRRRQPSPIL